MKKTIVPLLSLAVLFTACNGSEQTTNEPTTDTAAVTAMDPAKDWKFGVALWTFHTVDFPTSLEQVDSVGVQYIEPNTFHAAGPALKDSLVGQLS